MSFLSAIHSFDHRVLSLVGQAGQAAVGAAPAIQTLVSILDPQIAPLVNTILSAVVKAEQLYIDQKGKGTEKSALVIDEVTNAVSTAASLGAPINAKAILDSTSSVVSAIVSLFNSFAGIKAAVAAPVK